MRHRYYNLERTRAMTEKKPSGVHYYHAKIMQDIEDSDWMKQDDDTPVQDMLTKECGIYATEDTACLL